MKILLVSPHLPYPGIGSGGGSVIFNYVKHLAKRHEISFLCFIIPEDEGHVSDLRMYCQRVETIPIKCNRHRSKIGVLLSRCKKLFLVFFSKKPLKVALLYSKHMERKIIELLQTGSYDVVQFEYAEMGQYITAVNNLPSVLSELEASMILRYRYFGSVKNTLKRVFYFMEWLKWMRYETSILKKFDKILTLTREDKILLKTFVPEANITSISTGMDIAEEGFSKLSNEVIPHRLMFFGDMYYKPNLDAVIYFCKEIFPIIKNKIPNISLYIVGPHSSTEVEGLRADPNITVMGYVRDLDSLIRKAAIVVVPIRLGGGIRIKTLHAMAMGKAVIATSLGAQGIDVIPEENIIIANEPEIFAKRTIELLENGQLRQRLGRNARKLIKEKYQWEPVIKKLERIYEEAVSFNSLSFH